VSGSDVARSLTARQRFAVLDMPDLPEYVPYSYVHGATRLRLFEKGIVEYHPDSLFHKPQMRLTELGAAVKAELRWRHDR
jgi:hypothetical protein